MANLILVQHHPMSEASQSQFLTGTIDEVRVDNVARTAIKSASLRDWHQNHNITIDFKAP